MGSDPPLSAESTSSNSLMSYRANLERVRACVQMVRHVAHVLPSFSFIWVYSPVSGLTWLTLPQGGPLPVNTFHLSGSQIPFALRMFFEICLVDPPKHNSLLLYAVLELI
jgi:hypothetical protein